MHISIKSHIIMLLVVFYVDVDSSIKDCGLPQNTQ